MMHHKRGCPLFTHVTQRGPGHPTVCTCGPRLKANGQPARLLRWLREHPGASSLEITQALYIVNVTGRVSDLRSSGYIVQCRRRPDGADGYVVVEPRAVTTGETVGMGLA